MSFQALTTGSFYQPVDYPVVYRCEFDTTSGGKCIASNSSYPNYDYRLFVDYSDRSLKVMALPMSRSQYFPAYTCDIEGWMTVTDVNVICANETVPGTFYCTGSKQFAVCVPED